MSAPNSVLRLYTGVPLDNTYQNVVYLGAFGNNPVTFLSNYSSIQINDMMWIKKDKNHVRVNCGVGSGIQHYPDWFYDYNYLTFNNGNKLYCCFITDCVYINDNTVEFQFEIDVFMSFWNEWSLQECFVEREHTRTDNIGSYVLPEPVPVDGVYECIGESECASFITQGEPRMLLFFAPPEGYKVGQGDHRYPTDGSTFNRYNGVYTPCESYSFNPRNSGELQGLANNLNTEFSNGWVCLMAVYIPTGLDTSDHDNPLESDDAFQRSTAILNGVTVHNKKILTAPYTYIEVTNQMGDSVKLQWELFSGANKDTAYFTIYGCILPSPTIICVPRNYRGMSSADFDCACVIDNFPAVPVQSSNIMNWIAQNQTSAAIKSLTGALTGIATGAVYGGAPGAVVGGITGAVLPLANYVAGEASQSKAPSSMTAGKNPNALINMLTGKLNFRFKNMCLRTDYIATADYYFTRYGYRVDMVKTPSMNNRTKYTYVKTRNCSLKANQLPVYAVQKICSCFDRGITFWRTTDIGNYDGNALYN